MLRNGAIPTILDNFPPSSITDANDFSTLRISLSGDPSAFLMRHRIVNNVSSVGPAATEVCLERTDRTDKTIDKMSLGFIAKVTSFDAFEDDVPGDILRNPVITAVVVEIFYGRLS